ncbi:catalase family protein [Lichenicoccus roseus]|uniref:Catalase family protein n=1 Tax=Lichenicoccus roseus TaxID=2683649 RepID=A0A5R9J098_9PROT|nr:catalase family protein [Lichenicoccus roseus]TLU70962.1 catalase family protein [Lichenicoccus roseus]
MPDNRPATDWVRYRDDLETVTPGENHTIDAIIATMTRESETVARRDGRTVRASHAKSTGLLKGEVVVLDNLPPPLRQGLFAAQRSYPAAVRLAQGPGEVLSDSVSTHRGMAIKIFDVEGEKLPGHAGATTQDFVLATGPAFPQGDADSFLAAIGRIERSTGLPEAVKQAVSSTARLANAALKAVGSDSASLGFFGHTRSNPLADAYYSQAALRYGELVAKLGVFPVSPALVAMIDRTIDTDTDPDAFRNAVIAYFREHDAEFEIRVQLCTDLDRMPVEDASVVWPEDESPYRPVARLLLPRQDAYGAARQDWFDQKLSFQPAHALAAFRPLGSLMRARLRTYRALSEYRHGRNGQFQIEPARIEDLPD